MHFISCLQEIGRGKKEKIFKEIIQHRRELTMTQKVLNVLSFVLLKLKCKTISAYNNNNEMGGISLLDFAIN